MHRINPELIWEGKYDAQGRRRPIRLPDLPPQLQPIEAIGVPGDPPDGFRNLLVWGDNKLALAALLERFHGQVDLIYLDPPFAIGADLTMRVPLGAGDARRNLELTAYSDSWGTGADSYQQMIFERLALARELLSPTGSIYVHCDYRVSAQLRLMLDELFGPERLRNEIIWHYQSGGRRRNQFSHKHDTIYWYSRSEHWVFNGDAVGQIRGEGRRNHMRRQVDPDGRVSFSIRSAGKLYTYYADERVTPPDVWTDISHIQQRDPQRTGYATQKPEPLLERIISASSHPGQLVADLFCGSGTTLAVAERLGRRWIGVDLGRQAISATRRRLLRLSERGDLRRPFDIYSLGTNERRWWQSERLRGEVGYHDLLLRRYGATALETPIPGFHGRRGPALVHLQPIDGVLSANGLSQLAEQARTAGAAALDCLCWDATPGLVEVVESITVATGVTMTLRLIPREIMELNRADCPFFSLGRLEARVVANAGGLDVELLHFTPGLDAALEEAGGSIVEHARRAPLDFIALWAIDFNWRPGQPFSYHWHTARDSKGTLATRSNIGWNQNADPDTRIGVKIIDIFGNETLAIISPP